MKSAYIKNLEFHARKAAWERYNIDISKRKLKEMEKQLQGKGRNIIERKKESVSRSQIIFSFEGKIFRVIYSRTFRKIVTFLPLVEEKENERR